MNIDELLSEADPAAGAEIPAHDSARARNSFDRMLASAHIARQRRRRLTLRASIACAAAGGLAASLLSGLPGTQASAAAIVLNRAAAAAARGHEVVLRRGDYLYTKTRSFSISVYGVNDIGIYTENVVTTQTWEKANGAGKTITDSGPRRFLPGSRARWIAAGKPAIALHGGRTVTWASKPSDRIPPDNLSHLPTDPAALMLAIVQGKTGLSDVTGDIEDPSSPGGTFAAAAIILEGPSVGGSPALRSALFKVMASVPGDRVLGRERSRSGRSGIAIQAPPVGKGVREIWKIIVDPRSGQILEFDTYPYPAKGGPAENWTAFLGSGVVGKIGQLPGR